MKEFLFSKRGVKTMLGTDQRSHNPQTGVGENFSIDEKGESKNFNQEEEVNSGLQ